MSIVTLAKNQTLVAVDGTDAVVYSDPVPLGDMNYLAGVLEVTNLFALAGTPTTITQDFQVQASNDAVNFDDVATFGDAVTATGSASKDGELSYAYARVRFTLSISGSAGDSGVATFDFRARLLRQ